MSREVRMVTPNWEHPRDERTNRYKPLRFGYEETKNEFEDMQSKQGLQEAIDNFGPAPDINDYMPDWSDEERTHYQMYESVSEGTPISPVMDSPEALAKWLVENNGDAGAGETASYEGWLRVCNGGYAPSMIIKNGAMINGVDGLLSLSTNTLKKE